MVENRVVGFSFAFGMSLVLFGVAVAFAVSQVIVNVASGLFGASLALLLLVKLSFLWLVRKRASHPETLLSVREWQWLSAGDFASAALALISGTLGAHRPWCWFLAVGASSLGWCYFVVSRHAAGKEWAA